MRQRTWFIGSRRRYGLDSAPTGAIERLDPAVFMSAAGPQHESARRREYELEVLERVIVNLRDPQPDILEHQQGSNPSRSDDDTSH